VLLPAGTWSVPAASMRGTASPAGTRLCIAMATLQASHQTTVLRAGCPACDWSPARTTCAGQTLSSAMPAQPWVPVHTPAHCA
jgi:hypothetical protein